MTFASRYYWYNITRVQGNPNHVHSTLVTLIIIKFPMISEVPKWKWFSLFIDLGVGFDLKPKLKGKGTFIVATTSPSDTILLEEVKA